MIETLAVQKILNDELSRAKIANPAYSLRALARRLRVSPTSLSLLLNGKRPASKKFASSLAESLGFNPSQTRELLSLFKSEQAAQDDESAKLRLSTDQFQVISDWQHFAVLSLLETKGAKADPEWIAGRLGISMTVASDTLERLERLNLVKIISKKRFTLTGHPIQTSDEIASSAIKKNHVQVLEQAKVSAMNDPLEIRDLLSVTMAIDASKIPQAKKLLREFRQNLCTFLESGERTEVYSFALQLIPLTNSGKTK